MKTVFLVVRNEATLCTLTCALLRSFKILTSVKFVEGSADQCLFLIAVNYIVVLLSLQQMPALKKVNILHMLASEL